ncbi:hypothetical protein WJX73_007148 [Symbiochloris irregularis]|uniref:Coenzyme Q-binding protein COQ10 START domain-containing protein n=1 Tax=Symbiochloris irregularis TaxID=706552 RepID=A0AAW1PWB0_9CHLO
MHKLAGLSAPQQQGRQSEVSTLSGSRRRLRQKLQALFSTLDAVGSHVERGSDRIKVLQLDKPRSKRVVGEVCVNTTVEQVWSVITDFEALPEFIPNLETTELVEGSPPGCVWLRQKACSQSLFWRLQASAVLELREVHKPHGRRELRFHMLEGDLQEFTGRWVLEPVHEDDQELCQLRYEISIVPKQYIPASIVRQVIKCGLPANLDALASRAERIALKKSGQIVTITNRPQPQSAADVEERERRWRGEGIPEKGSVRAPWPTVRLQSPQKPKKEIPKPQKQSARSSDYLGVESVPLPGSTIGQQAAVQPFVSNGVANVSESEQRQQIKQALQASYPAFEVGKRGSALQVHLRRLDGPNHLHRRAVAAVNVEAPVEAVWDVLTDYERLAEFIPNLALCERVQLPASAPSRFTRLRQVGYKNMQWMILHAEAELDIVERPCSELQFRQHNGDFDLLQGKFMLHPVEPLVPSAAAPTSERTELKYAVEVQIPQSTLMLGLLEPLLERVVFEDLPANLAALKTRVESLHKLRQAEEADAKAGKSATVKDGKPTGSSMAQDFSLLASELQRLCGDTSTIPTRADLRAMNRNDIEKAMAGHGGPWAVAQRMGWTMKSRGKRPWGWWDDIANVRSEVDEYTKLAGLPARHMPSKASVVKAGRHDLARAIERWGGLYQLAEALGYEVSSPVEEGVLLSRDEADAESETAAVRRRDKASGARAGSMRREIDNW